MPYRTNAKPIEEKKEQKYETCRIIEYKPKRKNNKSYFVFYFWGFTLFLSMVYAYWCRVDGRIMEPSILLFLSFLILGFIYILNEGKMGYRDELKAQTDRASALEIELEEARAEIEKLKSGKPSKIIVCVHRYARLSDWEKAFYELGKM